MKYEPPRLLATKGRTLWSVVSAYANAHHSQVTLHWPAKDDEPLVVTTRSRMRYGTSTLQFKFTAI